VEDRALNRVYTGRECRELDRIAIEEFGISGFELMKRAGQAAFSELLARWPDASCLTILCGKGNNAGDGYIIGGLAREIGMAVQLIQLGDAGELAGDAARARDWAVERGVAIEPGPERALRGDVVVDALLGTGIAGELRPAYREQVEAANASGIGVLAVDVPTGVDADTGAATDPCVRADVTVTFIGRKLGLVTGPGASFCGDVVLAGLGVPDQVYGSVAGTALLVNEHLGTLPARDANAYKQALGHLVVIGGDRNMGGAALMAGEAALRVGAGLVSVVTRAAHRPAILARRPELMVVDADDDEGRRDVLARATTVVLGPGLGRSAWGERLAREALALGKPAVIDADGLYWIATSALEPSAPVIITPHSGEAAMLLDATAAAIQADRVTAVKDLAEKVGGVAVLKGAGTLIAEHRGSTSRLAGVCGHGNPGMASAGMGDVLSGIIGGLLAQRDAPVDAAVRGVCLHSAAADVVARQVGQRSMLATDLLPEVMSMLAAGEQ
jgi:hydroxyethylthiazole kinase-like uncharacterized protein yjeF